MALTRIVVLCSGVFIAGTAVGGGIIWAMTHRSTEQAIANDAAAGIGGKLFVLEALRGGDTSKAASVLETSLDSDLITIGLVPEVTIDAPMRRIIERAADYRIKHPHKSGDSTIDDGVSRVLAARSKVERK